MNHSGFTYIEAIVAVVLAWIIGIGLFRVNDFFLNNNLENRKLQILESFASYVAGVVDAVPITDDFHVIPNQAFYITLPDENHFVYSMDPSYKTKDIGFFNLAFSGWARFGHEIRYLGTGAVGSISWVYYHYRASVSYGEKSKVFYFSR